MCFDSDLKTGIEDIMCFSKYIVGVLHGDSVEFDIVCLILTQKQVLRLNGRIDSVCWYHIETTRRDAFCKLRPCDATSIIITLTLIEDFELLKSSVST